MPSSPSSCLPPLPHAPPPFPLLSSPLAPLPCTPPPSVFPMDCLPIDSYCICTSLFIIPPLSPLTALSIFLFHSLIFIFSHSAMTNIQVITIKSKYTSEERRVEKKCKSRD